MDYVHTRRIIIIINNNWKLTKHDDILREGVLRSVMKININLL